MQKRHETWTVNKNTGLRHNKNKNMSSFDDGERDNRWETPLMSLKNSVVDVLGTNTFRSQFNNIL